MRILLLFLYCQAALAGFVDLPSPPLDGKDAGDYAAGGAKGRSFIYVVPNEIHPEEAQPIVKEAKPGVYLSVGADRGFLGAAQTPGATHLLLMDLSPEVIFYNQVNIALLRASGSLDEYLRLRSGGDPALWKKAASHPSLTEADRKILRDPGVFSKFDTFQKPATERLLQPEWFKGSSYLKDPQLFGRLQKMAREDKIQVIQGNLNDEKFLASIGRALEEKKLPVSVVDISNAWDHKYTGSKGVHRIVRNLGGAMKDNSIFLVSHARQKLDDHIYHWDMYGYTKEALEKAEKEVGSPSAMYSMIRGEKLRPRSTLTTAAGVDNKVVTVTKWMDLLRETPEFAAATVRKMVRVRNCVWGAPKCDLPKLTPPTPVEIAVPEKMQLLAWQPRGNDFAYLIPQRAGETAEQALERYISRLEELPDMQVYAAPLREAGTGRFALFPKDAKEPIAAAMATTRGNRMIDDMLPNPPKMHRMLDPFVQRGAKAFVIPPGVGFGLEGAELAEYRKLLSESVDILAAPGGFDVHPSFYGQPNRHSQPPNKHMDQEQIETIKSFLDREDGGYFLGVCRGEQMGAVALGCDLVQDIDYEVPNAQKHTPRWKIFGSKHDVKKQNAEPGSITDRIFRDDMKITTKESRHHQAVLGGNERVRITGVSPEDNVAELVEFYSPNGKNRGIGSQFHFEREPNDFSKRIFQTIYEEGQKARDQRLMRSGLSPKPDFLMNGRGCSRDFSKIYTGW